VSIVAKSVECNDAERQQEKREKYDDDEDDNTSDRKDNWRHSKLTSVAGPIDSFALRYHCAHAHTQAYYAAVLMSHITGLARLSVCPSVRPRAVCSLRAS